MANEQVGFLNRHAIQVDPNALEAAIGIPVAEEQDADEAVIKGTTTFYDLYRWGVSGSGVISLLGGELPPTGMLIRDFCTQNGLNFATLKTELQLLVDKARE